MIGGSAHITPDEHEVRCIVTPGETIPDDLLGAWCTGRNITIWAMTEGLDHSAPILCCAGPTALAFVTAMSDADVFAEVDLLPCCQGSLEAEGEEHACIRDTFDDHPAAVLDVLRAAAHHHAIGWPADIAGAPELT